jgi:hypothetical protein
MPTDGEQDNLSIIEYTHSRTGCRLLALWRAGLKRLDYLLFDHHVEIVLVISAADERGLCDNVELECLADLEEELLDGLGNTRSSSATSRAMADARYGCRSCP